MVDQYNLVIKDVGFQDEGIYECDTGEQRLTLALQVAGAGNYTSVVCNVHIKTMYISPM